MGLWIDIDAPDLMRCTILTDIENSQLQALAGMYDLRLAMKEDGNGIKSGT